MFLNCKLPCLNLWDYWKTFLINIKMGGSEVDRLFKADQLVCDHCSGWPWPLVTWNSDWRHPDTGHTLCNTLVMDQTLHSGKLLGTRLILGWSSNWVNLEHLLEFSGCKLNQKTPGSSQLYTTKLPLRKTPCSQTILGMLKVMTV